MAPVRAIRFRLVKKETPMPRQVRDTNLETRAARGRLKVRRKEYFRLIEPGLHLAYRKLASGPGTWARRKYNGAGGYTLENLRTPDGQIVVADDYDDGDGFSVLTFAQAQNAIRTMRTGAGSRYTVSGAVADYLAARTADGRDISDAKSRFDAHVLPALGNVECASLATEQIRKWHRGLANAAPRRRTKPGDRQKFGEKGELRSRQASANRVLTLLKAALNHVFHDGKIESNRTWSRVKPFKGVETSRVDYLTQAEAGRLINACDPDFRPLVIAGLQSGARYGQIAGLRVRDFNPDAGTLHVVSHKGDGSARDYHITLTEEGIEFFRGVCAGRTGSELMFCHSDGSVWLKSHQKRPMLDAVARAKVNSNASFHTLRHTWASHAVMNGMPLMVVARNLGHADTRMVERHYGHLAPSYIADEIRKAAPRFGTGTGGNITPLR
jgi:integrase